jgi:hypothetical protein
MRRQARRGNGRFTRNTMENTFGLHCDVCPNDECRRLNPSPVGAPRPTHCHACGAALTQRAADVLTPESAARTSSATNQHAKESNDVRNT